MATYGAFIKGYALTAAGQSQEGQAACEEAVRLAPERISRAYASAVLGYNYLVPGDARAAVELLPPVIEELGRFPYPPWEGLFAAKLAEAWLEVGDLAEARRAAERAVRVTESCGFPFGAGWARRALGRVAVAQGKPAEGRADLDRAREIFRSLGARSELADARSGL